MATIKIKQTKSKIGRTPNQVKNIKALGLRKIGQIVEKEERMRAHLKKNNLYEIEDDCCRAYGLLTNARRMSTEEAMKLLSLLKLGKEMEIIDNAKDKDIYRLMVKIQPNNILSSTDTELTTKERDKMRAEIIRNELLEN